MELFVPGVVTLLVAWLIYYFLMPRASIYVLGGICIVSVFVGYYHHRKLFPYEYNLSETKEILKDYALFITLMFTILLLRIILAQVKGTSGGEAAVAAINSAKASAAAGVGAIAAALPQIPQLPEMPKLPEMPQMPQMPQMPDLGLGVRANNGSRVNNRGNIGRRNNIASTSFKET